MPRKTRTSAPSIVCVSSRFNEAAARCRGKLEDSEETPAPAPALQ